MNGYGQDLSANSQLGHFWGALQGITCPHLLKELLLLIHIKESSSFGQQEQQNILFLYILNSKLFDADKNDVLGWIWIQI
jgi:hypothetical protein